MERRAKERCRKPARAEVNRTIPTPATALSDKFVNVVLTVTEVSQLVSAPDSLLAGQATRARVSLCVCVSVRLCVRASVSERERGERGREGESRRHGHRHRPAWP